MGDGLGIDLAIGLVVGALARWLVPLHVALGLALVCGATGCASDVEDDDGEQVDQPAEDESALTVSHLDHRFGASGVTFKGTIDAFQARGWNVTDHTHGNSEKVFGRLRTAGLRHLRQTPPLSFHRWAITIPAEVAEAKRYGVDLFLSIHLEQCMTPVAPGDVGNANKDPACNDIAQADLAAATQAFKNHFQAAWNAANPNGERNVTTWGINEPDLNLRPLADAPERAAAFYQAAREVLDGAGCPATACTLVAGELAHGSPAWTKRYVRALAARHQKVDVFSMHPYLDVDRALASNWKTVRPSTSLDFMSVVKTKYPQARFWFTESGRMLHKKRTNPSFSTSEANEWAAGIFVRRRLARMARVDRVYWYDMAASPGGWDSALADNDGKARASYWGLLGISETQAERRAKGNPRPGG